MATKEERADARAEARADAKAEAKAEAAEARAADRAEAMAAMKTAEPTPIPQGHIAVEVMSDFVGHERKALSKGERVTLPRALALAMIQIGNARAITAEEGEKV
jgi:hypothetical protein